MIMVARLLSTASVVLYVSDTSSSMTLAYTKRQKSAYTSKPCIMRTSQQVKKQRERKQTQTQTHAYLAVDNVCVIGLPADVIIHDP